MVSRYALVLVGFLLMSDFTIVQACTCVEPVLSDRDSAAEQFKRASVVFEGEVLSVQRPEIHVSSVVPSYEHPGVSEITFRVLRSYKGAGSEIVHVYSDFATTSCAVDAAPGERWFVYGFEHEDHKLHVVPCTRSGGLEGHGADVRLARGDPANPEDLVPWGDKTRLLFDHSLGDRGASLSGTVRNSEGVEVADALVSVWQSNEHGERSDVNAMKQKANADGTFSFHYLPPGAYLLGALAPDGKSEVRYVGVYGALSLQERENVSNADVVLHPEPLGTIRVHIHPPDAPLDRIFVVLRDVDLDADTIKGQSNLYPFGDTAVPGRDGDVIFKTVPYAHYNLSVRMTGTGGLEAAGWTQEATQVELAGPCLEVTLHLKKSARN